MMKEAVVGSTSSSPLTKGGDDVWEGITTRVNNMTKAAVATTATSTGGRTHGDRWLDDGGGRHLFFPLLLVVIVAS